MRSLWERFLESFGSPNYIDNQFQREGTPNEGLYLTQGIHATPAYDFENAQYLLCFGSEILESYWSPVQALAGYGQLRRGRPGQRGKLVYIGPRLSITGIKADEWIPISPGTEGMLALGIAHMIVKEGLQNKSFVSNHTFGFDNWMDGSGKEHPGFKEILLSEYEASLVSTRTGVPIDVIIRLAREFASNQPSLAMGCRDRPFHQMAVSVLNGLVGSIDSPEESDPKDSLPTAFRFRRSRRSQRPCDAKSRWGQQYLNGDPSPLPFCQECSLREALQA
jgi:predicted molibdopterin-dependent oxidoreductase YjgC